jgi:hypothetical protein
VSTQYSPKHLLERIVLLSLPKITSSIVSVQGIQANPEIERQHLGRLAPPTGVGLGTWSCVGKVRPCHQKAQQYLCLQTRWQLEMCLGNGKQDQKAEEKKEHKFERGKSVKSAPGH